MDAATLWADDASCVSTPPPVLLDAVRAIPPLSNPWGPATPEEEEEMVFGNSSSTHLQEDTLPWMPDVTSQRCDEPHSEYFDTQIGRSEQQYHYLLPEKDESLYQVSDKEDDDALAYVPSHHEAGHLSRGTSLSPLPMREVEECWDGDDGLTLHDSKDASECLPQVPPAFLHFLDGFLACHLKEQVALDEYRRKEQAVHEIAVNSWKMVSKVHESIGKCRDGYGVQFKVEAKEAEYHEESGLVPSLKRMEVFLTDTLVTASWARARCTLEIQEYLAKVASTATDKSVTPLFQALFQHVRLCQEVEHLLKQQSDVDSRPTMDEARRTLQKWILLCGSVVCPDATIVIKELLRTPGAGSWGAMLLQVNGERPTSFLTCLKQFGSAPSKRFDVSTKAYSYMDLYCAKRTAKSSDDEDWLLVAPNGEPPTFQHCLLEEDHIAILDQFPCSVFSAMIIPRLQSPDPQAAAEACSWLRAWLSGACGALSMADGRYPDLQKRLAHIIAAIVMSFLTEGQEGTCQVELSCLTCNTLLRLLSDHYDGVRKAALEIDLEHAARRFSREICASIATNLFKGITSHEPEEGVDLAVESLIQKDVNVLEVELQVLAGLLQLQTSAQEALVGVLIRLGFACQDSATHLQDLVTDAISYAISRRPELIEVVMQACVSLAILRGMGPHVFNLLPALLPHLRLWIPTAEWVERAYSVLKSSFASIGEDQVITVLFLRTLLTCVRWDAETDGCGVHACAIHVLQLLNLDALESRRVTWSSYLASAAYSTVRRRMGHVLNFERFLPHVPQANFWLQWCWDMILRLPLDHLPPCCSDKAAAIKAVPRDNPAIASMASFLLLSMSQAGRRYTDFVHADGWSLLKACIHTTPHVTPHSDITPLALRLVLRLYFLSDGGKRLADWASNPKYRAVLEGLTEGWIEAQHSADTCLYLRSYIETDETGLVTFLVSLIALSVPRFPYHMRARPVFDTFAKVCLDLAASGTPSALRTLEERLIFYLKQETASFLTSSVGTLKDAVLSLKLLGSQPAPVTAVFPSLLMVEPHGVLLSQYLPTLVSSYLDSERPQSALDMTVPHYSLIALAAEAVIEDEEWQAVCQFLSNRPLARLDETLDASTEFGQHMSKDKRHPVRSVMQYSIHRWKQAVHLLPQKDPLFPLFLQGYLSRLLDVQRFSMVQDTTSEVLDDPLCRYISEMSDAQCFQDALEILRGDETARTPISNLFRTADRSCVWWFPANSAKEASSVIPFEPVPRRNVGFVDVCKPLPIAPIPQRLVESVSIRKPESCGYTAGAPSPFDHLLGESYSQLVASSEEFLRKLQKLEHLDRKYTELLPTMFRNASVARKASVPCTSSLSSIYESGTKIISAVRGSTSGRLRCSGPGELEISYLEGERCATSTEKVRLNRLDAYKTALSATAFRDDVLLHHFRVCTTIASLIECDPDELDADDALYLTENGPLLFFKLLPLLGLSCYVPLEEVIHDSIQKLGGRFIASAPFQQENVIHFLVSHGASKQQIDVATQYLTPDVCESIRVKPHDRFMFVTLLELCLKSAVDTMLLEALLACFDIKQWLTVIDGSAYRAATTSLFAALLKASCNLRTVTSSGMSACESILVEKVAAIFSLGFNGDVYVDLLKTLLCHMNKRDVPQSMVSALFEAPFIRQESGFTRSRLNDSELDQVLNLLRDHLKQDIVHTTPLTHNHNLYVESYTLPLTEFIANLALSESYHRSNPTSSQRWLSVKMTFSEWLIPEQGECSKRVFSESSTSEIGLLLSSVTSIMFQIMGNRQVEESDASDICDAQAVALPNGFLSFLISMIRLNRLNSTMCDLACHHFANVPWEGLQVSHEFADELLEVITNPCTLRSAKVSIVRFFSSHCLSHGKYAIDPSMNAVPPTVSISRKLFSVISFLLENAPWTELEACVAGFTGVIRDLRNTNRLSFALSLQEFKALLDELGDTTISLFATTRCAYFNLLRCATGIGVKCITRQMRKELHDRMAALNDYVRFIVAESDEFGEHRIFSSDGLPAVLAECLEDIDHTVADLRGSGGSVGSDNVDELLKNVLLAPVSNQESLYNALDVAIPGLTAVLPELVYVAHRHAPSVDQATRLVETALKRAIALNLPWSTLKGQLSWKAGHAVVASCLAQRRIYTLHAIACKDLIALSDEQNNLKLANTLIRWLADITQPANPTSMLEETLLLVHLVLDLFGDKAHTTSATWLGLCQALVELMRTISRDRVWSDRILSQVPLAFGKSPSEVASPQCRFLVTALSLHLTSGSLDDLRAAWDYYEATKRPHGVVETLHDRAVALASNFPVIQGLLSKTEPEDSSQRALIMEVYQRCTAFAETHRVMKEMARLLDLAFLYNGR